MGGVYNKQNGRGRKAITVEVFMKRLSLIALAAIVCSAQSIQSVPTPVKVGLATTALGATVGALTGLIQTQKRAFSYIRHLRLLSDNWSDFSNDPKVYVIQHQIQ